MKSKVIMIVVLVGLLKPGYGQTFKEWFRQKKTQKEYLIEQIAQLRIYLELTKKGYKSAKEGLTAIGEIKNGELKLHKNYVDSLKVVNPKIASLPKVKWINTFSSNVKNVCSACLSKKGLSDYLSSNELAYLRAVFDQVESECERIQSMLQDVISDGKLAMTDDERVKRIDELYQQALFNLAFSKVFCNEPAVLAAARMKEKEDVITSRALHGIN